MKASLYQRSIATTQLLDTTNPNRRLPSEIELLKKEFEQEKASFAIEISQLKEEKGQLEMGIYFMSSEMDRAIKERDRFKDDLESLTKDYVTLKKANKSWCIGKTSVQWEAKVTTLNRELNQQKKEIRTNKEKFMRARAFTSTY